MFWGWTKMPTSGRNGAWYFSLLLRRNQAARESYLPWNAFLHLCKPCFELQCLRIDNCMKSVSCPQTPAFLLRRCRIEDTNGSGSTFANLFLQTVCYSAAKQKETIFTWFDWANAITITSLPVGWDEELVWGLELVMYGKDEGMKGAWAGRFHKDPYCLAGLWVCWPAQGWQLTARK